MFSENTSQFAKYVTVCYWDQADYLKCSMIPNFWHKKGKGGQKGNLILLFRSLFVVSSFHILVPKEYSNLSYTIDQREDSFLFPFLKNRAHIYIIHKKKFLMNR